MLSVREALRFAKLFRPGELVAVHVPKKEDEAFRDLVRAREDAKEDLSRHYQCLGQFFLRHQIIAPPKATRTGSKAHEEWLDTLKFEHECHRVTYQEYRQSIRETQERIKRYEREIESQANTVGFGSYTVGFMQS